MPELRIKVTSDSTDARRDLDGFSGAMERAALPAAVAGGAIVAFGADAGAAASEAQQAAGALEATFGDATAAMAANAQGAADNLGLSEASYSQLASTIGSQLGNMGVAQDEVGATTDALITKGADLAAQFGGSTAEAVDALSSLMRGERDPIERYGVSISAAAIEAEKAAQGLDGLEGAADRAATTQATLTLLNEQTASSAGAFARETDTAAGAQAIATANWEDGQAALGSALLPAMTAGAQILAGFSRWVQDNSTVVLVLVGVLGTLAAGVLAYNAVTAAIPAIQALATAAQWAWNAAMSANPLGLIVLAIAAVVAGIVLLVKNWDTVKAVALATWTAISGAVTAAAEWLLAQWDAAVATVTGWFNAYLEFWLGLWDSANAAVGAAAAWLSDKWDEAIAAVVGWFEDLGADALALWTSIEDGFGGAAQWFQDQWDAAVAFVGNLFGGWLDDISNTIDRVVGFFLDIPGKISRAFSRVRLPSWLSSVTGFFGFSAPVAALTASSSAAATFAAGGYTPAPRITVGAAGGGVNININVEGALDARAVARQIRGILNTDARVRGVVDLAGVVVA